MGATSECIQHKCAELGICIPTQSLWFYANTTHTSAKYTQNCVFQQVQENHVQPSWSLPNNSLLDSCL